MKGLLRRVRGIIGTAATWAIAWMGLGAGIGALVGYDLSFLLRMAMNNSVAGLVAGASFAVILSVAERNHSLEDLSLGRVALWGTGGGLLLSLIPLAAGVPLAYLLGPLVINAGIGAGMAAGSVAMAKRAEDRRLIPSAANPMFGLEGD
jgi:hypothetical protein